MARIKYNLDEKATLGEIIELIIHAVYPDDESSVDRHRKAAKRIRGMISEAISKESLITIKKGAFLSQNLEINAPEFFKWAVTVEKWGLKSRVDDLPIEYIVHAAATTAVKKSKLTASAVVIPGDPEKLKREYLRSEAENARLTEKNEVLKSMLGEAEMNLSACKEELDRCKNSKAAINKKKGRRTV